MRHTLIVTTIIVTLLTLSLPGVAHAQATSTNTPVPHDQVLSTNPLGVLAQWFNGEYERKIGPSTTVGVAASIFQPADYAGASLIARWYPQQAALEGVYVGARVGAFRFESYTRNGRVTSVFPGVGLEIGHAWLLGAKRNTSINIGFGLTRLVHNSANGYVPDILPNARLVNVGVAF